MSRATRIVGILAIVASTAAAGKLTHRGVAAQSPYDGVFEYVGKDKGLAILTNGRFSFVYGPADGSAPMSGDAGSYRVARDTATGNVAYSTVPERVGAVYRWRITSDVGDTVSYVTFDSTRKVVGGGRAVRRH
jgi:hypothetical protein